MTITYNVRLNIQPWISGTYAVGNRTSAGGNAYQCITPGSSTSAPTGMGSAINNGGQAVWKYSTAVDFTSLSAFAGAINGLTLTDNYVALLWNDNGVVTTNSTTPFLALFGITSGSFTITITPAPGEGYRDNAGMADAFSTTNGVAFQGPFSGSPGSNANWFFCGVDNVILDGIQIQDPNPASGFGCFTMVNPNAIVRNCIVDTSYGSGIYFSSTGFLVANCLVIDRSTDAGATVQGAVKADTAAAGTVVNTGIINVGGGRTGNYGFQGIPTSINSVFVRNCWIFGYSRCLVLGVEPGVVNNGIVADHCCIGDASIAIGITDGGGNLLSRSASQQFIDTHAATDFRLVPTADCANTGVTDTTDIPTADDQYRTARPQGIAWDIGPYEIPAHTPETTQFTQLVAF